VEKLRLRIQDLGFRVLEFVLRLKISGFRIWGLGFAI
jgi:hypothetical protein